MDAILEEGVMKSAKVEINRETIILDVGEPLTYLNLDPSELQRRGVIFTFGGLLGELIVTFTALLEYILSNPANSSFKFT
jgi:hypothetical protein